MASRLDAQVVGGIRKQRDKGYKTLYSYQSLIDQNTMQTITTTLSSKFQISIPKAVREEQQWEAGQEFVFIPKGKGMLMMPAPELKQLRGIAKGAKTHNVRDRKDRV